MAARPWALLALLALGCAPLAAAGADPGASSCPVGSRPDALRTASLRQLLARDPEAATLSQQDALWVCYANGSGAGVLSGELAILDGRDADLALAARLAHLLVHRRDHLGDGCARGLAAARESERRAQLLEARLRARDGLPPLPATDETERDYRTRCPAK